MKITVYRLESVDGKVTHGPYCGVDLPNCHKEAAIDRACKALKIDVNLYVKDSPQHPMPQNDGLPLQMVIADKLKLFPIQYAFQSLELLNSWFETLILKEFEKPKYHMHVAVWELNGDYLLGRHQVMFNPKDTDNRLVKYLTIDEVLEML